MMKTLLALFKTAPPADPLALAQAKRTREKQLLSAGLSNKQAKTQVAREFSGRKA